MMVVLLILIRLMLTTLTDRIKQYNAKENTVSIKVKIKIPVSERLFTKVICFNTLRIGGLALV